MVAARQVDGVIVDHGVGRRGRDARGDAVRRTHVKAEEGACGLIVCEKGPACGSEAAISGDGVVEVVVEVPGVDLLACCVDAHYAAGEGAHYIDIGVRVVFDVLEGAVAALRDFGQVVLVQRAARGGVPEHDVVGAGDVLAIRVERGAGVYYNGEQIVAMVVLNAANVELGVVRYAWEFNHLDLFGIGVVDADGCVPQDAVAGLAIGDIGIEDWELARCRGDSG